jgi:hypothetical protein
MIASMPEGLSIEIRPLVRSRGWRLRLAAAGLAVAGLALVGAARLIQAWETGLRRGDFSDLPLPLLLALSLAVGLSTPLALAGLAALAFAEESIEVSRETVTIRTTAFERTRVSVIPRRLLECWRETRLPLSPWWTWSVRRLAARAGGRLIPLAGAVGPREKREIGLTLARATGRPLLGDFGRLVG